MWHVFLSIFLLLNACVETVVLGTIATGVLLTSGGVFDTSNDSTIKNSIKNVFEDSQNKSEYDNINVVVFNGKVLLSGRVSSDIYKRNAYNAAKYVKDGIEIFNEIVVSDQKPRFSVVRDSSIHSQIFVKLKATDGIMSKNYKYSVVDGNVFVIGVARNRDELSSVVNVISRTSGVLSVVSYIDILKS